MYFVVRQGGPCLRGSTSRGSRLDHATMDKNFRGLLLLAGAPNAVVPHRPCHDPRRLRAYCTELTARNPRLRKCLGDVAALILARATSAEPPVVRSAAEILRGQYTRAWHPC